MYRRHVPFITGDPEVDTIPLDPVRDQFLLLLSDGMYTLLADDRLVQMTYHYLVDHDDDPDLVAKHVLEQGIREDRGPADVVTEPAHAGGVLLTTRCLRGLRPAKRRRLMDDATVMVVTLQDRYRSV